MAKRDEVDMDKLKETLSTLKAQLQDIEGGFEKKFKQKAIDIKDNFEHKIEQNPIGSVGIAFGAGVLSGVALYAMMRKR